MSSFQGLHGNNGYSVLQNCPTWFGWRFCWRWASVINLDKDVYCYLDCSSCYLFMCWWYQVFLMVVFWVFCLDNSTLDNAFLVVENAQSLAIGTWYMFLQNSFHPSFLLPLYGRQFDYSHFKAVTFSPFWCICQS